MRTDAEFDIKFTLNTADNPSWQFILQYQDIKGNEIQAISNAWYDQDGGGHEVRFNEALTC